MAKKPLFHSDAMPTEEKTAFYAALDALTVAGRKLATATTDYDNARKALIDTYFTSLDEGTSTVMLEFGKKLVIKQAMYYKVDADLLEAASTNRALSAEIVNEVIRYKAEVSVSGYKGIIDKVLPNGQPLLSVDERRTLMEMITVTPGKPTFAIEDVKP